jgi:ribosomal protein L44E
MKEVRREIPARVSIRYVCETCGNKYKKKSMAFRCEARPLEKASFKLGDRVKGRSPRACGNTNKPTNLSTCSGQASRLI